MASTTGPGKSSTRLAPVRGLVQLAVSGVHGVTHIAEGLHANILGLSPILGPVPERRTRGIPGLVYGAIRGTSRLIGSGLDGGLRAAELLLPGSAGAPADMPDAELAAVSALNGVLGDHLERTGNPLALPMQLMLPAQRGRHVVVLIHGLCMNDRQWTRNGHDHGLALEQTLGWSPVFVRYNSGRHISTNGAELAQQLEALLAQWPVPVDSLSLIGHSMGGLVARSAVAAAEQAGLSWRAKLRSMVFLGTPHHGALLERGGNWLHSALALSPYITPFAKLGRLRSDGITDLRHGNLLAQDWEGGTYAHRDTRTPVPLPRGVACYAIAGAIGPVSGHGVVGDGLVSVASALGRHASRGRALRVPKANMWIAQGVGHLELLGNRGVGERVVGWLRASSLLAEGRIGGVASPPKDTALDVDPRSVTWTEAWSGELPCKARTDDVCL